MAIDKQQAALNINQAIQILKIAEGQLNDVRLALARAENCLHLHDSQKLVAADKLRVEGIVKESSYVATGLNALLSELAPSSDESSS